MFHKIIFLTPPAVTWYLRGKAMAKAFMLLWEMKEDLSFLMILQKTVGSIEGKLWHWQMHFLSTPESDSNAFTAKRSLVVCLFRGRIQRSFVMIKNIKLESKYPGLLR